LQSLFVLDNELKTLTGIENMVNLTQIYFQNNQITSIEPLRKLINLVDVFAFDNKITALKGLTEKHSRNLTNFRILPNADLPQKEIIKLENRVGIRCLRG
jgi:Leucine-rich repeat (LRR) protein